MNKNDIWLRYATHDITCYKVVDRNFKSPYRGFQYSIGETYHTIIYKPNCQLQNDKYSDDMKTRMFQLNSELEAVRNYYHFFRLLKQQSNSSYNDLINMHNGFHTYQGSLGAETDINVVFNKHLILECVIPKYTWYYLGLYDFKSAFVSESLRVIGLAELDT